MEPNINWWVVSNSVFPWEEDIGTVKSRDRNELQECKYGQVSIGSVQNKNYYKISLMAIPILKTLSSNRTSAVHATGKMSRCAPSKVVVLLEEEATDLLQRPSLAFCSVAKSALERAGLRRQKTVVLVFLRSLNWKIKILPKHAVSNSSLSARDKFCIVRFCKTRVVGMTFWPMPGRRLTWVWSRLKCCLQTGPGAAAIVRCAHPACCLIASVVLIKA